MVTPLIPAVRRQSLVDLREFKASQGNTRPCLNNTSQKSALHLQAMSGSSTALAEDTKSFPRRSQGRNAEILGQQTQRKGGARDENRSPWSREGKSNRARPGMHAREVVLLEPRSHCTRFTLLNRTEEGR